MALTIFTSACGKKSDAPEDPNAPVAKARQNISTPMIGARGTMPMADETKSAEGVPPSPAVQDGADEPKAALAPTEGSAPSAPQTEPAQPTDAAPKTTSPSPQGPDDMPVTAPAVPISPRPPADTKDLKSIAAPTVTVEDAAIPSSAQPVKYEPKVIPQADSVDIIIDASGSMSAPYAATSETKFDVLRKSVLDTITEMTDQQRDYPRNVALRTFGAKYPSTDNKCEDTELLVPMGEPNFAEIQKAIMSIKPQGTSPLAFVLDAVAKDFTADGSSDRVAVLISDGSDNCGGDVCETAKKIDALPQKFILQIIGFDVTAEDGAKLECAAKATGGKYYLARNEDELRSKLSEAVNSSVPYNLKLTARAGATPIPCDLTIMKANSSEVVKREKSFGTKLINLKPGTYDILIEYKESPESKKPSKILKGVEILKTTKVEQMVNFDLAQVTLSAYAAGGKTAPGRYEFRQVSPDDKSGGVFTIVSDDQSKSVFVSPGTYDIQAELASSGPDSFTLSEKGVSLAPGASFEKSFKFQKGSVKAKGMTTQALEIPFIIQAYRQGKDDAPVASITMNAGGGSLELAPGVYDLIAIGTDPKMIASPRTKVTGVQITPETVTDVTIKFEMGSLKIAAVDGQGNKIPAEFTIRDHTDNSVIARAQTDASMQINIPIPPGSYDIVATSLKSTLEPRPSVTVPTLQITADKPVEETVKFILGTLRLRGRNAKEQPIRTQFTVYKAGTEEIVSSAPPSSDWVVFDISPGKYDVLASDESVKGDSSKHMIWLRDLTVDDGKSISHEAIYTAGKLKIIGRGANNKLITSSFKVFEYGADRELISGVTGDDWEVFEIEPGKYYLEASYVDSEHAVVLKKWINISIGENEVVEQVLRF